jgi:hypothetical protein
MADKIILDHPRYKGSYDFDIVDEPFTNLEWRWVKKISGYLPLTLNAGWEGRDPDLFVAFAVVALHRAGKIRPEEALQVAASFDDATFGEGITLAPDPNAEEEEETPTMPAETPDSEQPTRNTGSSLRTISVAPVDDQSHIGVPV